MNAFLLAFGIWMGLHAVSGCPDDLEVAFIVDGSGSVGSSNWMVIQDFLVEVITRFQIGTGNVRVGMVRFGSNSHIDWRLTGSQTTNAASLQRALSRIRYPGGNTATSRGLRDGREVLSASGRSSVGKVVLVITDGKSNRYHNELVAQANQLKSISRVIAIGVSNYDMEELLQIASSPCDIYTVADFSQMRDDMNARMDQICGCMPGYFRSSNCQCQACDRGTYQPNWGHTSCMPCPVGTTTSHMGASACQPECGPGMQFNSRRQMCEPCEIGKYKTSSGQEQCEPCQTGYSTRRPGATRQEDCERKCGRGFSPTVDGCEPCGIRFYQPSEFARTCIPCPDGFSTRNTGSTSMRDCEAECSTGQYDDGTGMCLPCPVGFYQNMTFERVCEPCPEGKSTRQNGSMSEGDCKVVCPPGFKSNKDETDCELCPKGFYQPERFSQTCIECPRGTTTAESGANSENDCLNAETSTQNKMSGGAIAGLVIGLLLLLLLIVFAVLFFLWWSRKKAYERSRYRAESTYNEVSVTTVTGPFAAVKGKKDSVLSHGSTISNKYSPDPTTKPSDQTSKGYSSTKYDNAAKSESPYDNQAKSDVTYDNTPSAQETYDYPKSSHLYDNLAADDGYDKPPPRPPKEGAIYANAS